MMVTPSYENLGIAELARTQERLHLVLDNVPALIAYYDSKTVQCVFANRSYAVANGKTVEWAIGRHCREIIGEAAWQLIAPQVELAMSGQEVRYEREINLPNAPRRYVEVNLLPHLLPVGELIGVFVLINDITRFRDAQVALSQSEERATQFSRAGTEGIIFYHDGVVLDCNEALENILQRPRAQIVGSQVTGFFPVRDQVVATRHIHLNRDTPYPANLMRADGSEIEVEITGRRTAYKGQEVTVAAVRDTSKVARVTESLLRSQARYRALVENADEAIIVSQSQKMVYANPAAERFFGMPAAQLIGTPSVYLIHPEDRRFVLDRRKAIIGGAMPREFEMRTIAPPTLEIESRTVVSWGKMFGAIIEWEDADAELIFVSDMTAQHESDEQMRKALQHEKELGDLKTRFVSMASHEFRTPLSTIQTSSELLQYYSDRLTTHQRNDAIADIQKSVQRMQAMIENFLTFGSMGADALKFTPQSLYVVSLVQEIVNNTLVMDGHQHSVEVDCDAQVTERLRLMLDEMLLRQMVGNLVANACKYSAPDTEVRVRLERQGQELYIAVSDSGIGIPSSEMPRLFDTFHRASNAATTKGTGLGLAIVKRAVTAHRGRLDVQSQLGHGSRFEVWLPWDEVVHDDFAPTQAPDVS